MGTSLLFGGQRTFEPALHATVGGVLSSWIVMVFAVSTLPALSVPKNVIVVIPSVLSVKLVELPLTFVLAIGCAPIAL